jgi:arsenite methyltransferase
MSTALDPEEIRESVRTYYGQRARGEIGECCGGATPSECEPAAGVAIQIGDLPQDVESFNLGCGDPVTLAALRDGETVLDLGSGGGLDCFRAARQVGTTGRVIGIDMTEDMLDRARRNLERLDLPQVEFRRGLIEALPVEDASVDVVISNCVINLAPDKDLVLREIARVLRPGGRLAVADIVSRGRLRPEWLEAPDSWECCCAGALEAEEYITRLVRAGFEDARLRAAEGRDVQGIPEGVPFSALITARKP